MRGGAVVLTVHDSQGNLVPPSPAAHPNWHPSYRHFRVSQTTRDLHDAYRNGFLALESLLDHVAPQQPHEGEGRWFKRAMLIADSQISVAHVLHPGSPSPLDELCDEFYTRGRTAVAHSKSSRIVILPFTPQSRTSLLDALDRLHRFYLELAAHVLGLRRGGLHLAPALLQAMDDVLANHDLFVTDDSASMDAGDTRPSPSGRPLVAMSPPTASRTGRRWWAVTGGAVADLDSIRRIVSVHDGRVGFVALLEADLMLSAADTFEAALSIRTVNAVDPVLRFSTWARNQDRPHASRTTVRISRLCLPRPVSSNAGPHHGCHSRTQGRSQAHHRLELSSPLVVEVRPRRWRAAWRPQASRDVAPPPPGPST